MSIYTEKDLVVVAKSGSEAIKMAVDYFNQSYTNQFEPDDFYYVVINVNEFSDPTIINE